MRRITSLTALLSLIIMIVTSVILYIAPQGRVAYWADWRFWGLDKTEWTNIHINVGLLFLLSSLVHLYLNWKAIAAYLKDKSKRLRVFTREFNIATALIALFVAGTYAGLPPFVWIIDANEALKRMASQTYGEPPYGHAELSSLKSFSQKTSLDTSESARRLKDAGIVFSGPEQTIKDIADNNGMSPQRLYDIIRPRGNPLSATGSKLPALPPAGFGKLTLDEVAGQYGLDKDDLLKVLAEARINAGPDMSVKEIAEKHSVSPMEVYERLKMAQ